MIYRTNAKPRTRRVINWGAVGARAVFAALAVGVLALIWLAWAHVLDESSWLWSDDTGRNVYRGNTWALIFALVTGFAGGVACVLGAVPVFWWLMARMREPVTETVEE